MVDVNPALESEHRVAHELPEWAQVAANLNPLYHCVQLVRDAVFGFKGWVDVYHLAVIVAFGLAAWRIAISRMERKLID